MIRSGKTLQRYFSLLFLLVYLSAIPGGEFVHRLYHYMSAFNTAERYSLSEAILSDAHVHRYHTSSQKKEPPSLVEGSTQSPECQVAKFLEQISHSNLSIDPPLPRALFFFQKIQIDRVLAHQTYSGFSYECPIGRGPPS